MQKSISILFFVLIMAANVKANTGSDTLYTYYDAARNKYVLKANELEYIPVSKKESSSGIYSGGTYESRELNKIERKKLVRLFNTALANKKAQTDKNIKPNAAVEISINNKSMSFMLKANSQINGLLNQYLKQLFKNLKT